MKKKHSGATSWRSLRLTSNSNKKFVSFKSGSPSWFSVRSENGNFYFLFLFSFSFSIWNWRFSSGTIYSGKRVVLGMGNFIEKWRCEYLRQSLKYDCSLLGKVPKFDWRYEAHKWKYYEYYEHVLVWNLN